jgi:DNA-binding CsgD family transcriptional regulator
VAVSTHSERDLARLLQFARELGLVETMAVFPQRAVELAEGLIKADQYFYGEINPRLRWTDDVVYPSDGPCRANHRRDREDGRRVIPDRRGRRHSEDAVASSHGLLVRRALAGKPSIGLPRPPAETGIRYWLACRLTTPPPSAIGLVLTRNRRPFDARERHLADQARLHLAAAYRRLELGLTASVLSGLLEQGTEYVDRGLIVVSRLGNVLAVNACARDLVERRFGTAPRTAAMLPAPLLRRFAAMCRVARRSSTAGSRKTTLAEGMVDLEIIPLLEQSDIAFTLVLTETRPDSCDRAIVDYGLTPRHCTILGHLSRGLTNKALARELGIAPATVKTHLEEIYRRLDVSNRTEAATVAREIIGFAGLN